MTAASEVLPDAAELERLAQRLSGRLKPGERLVYCRGSLTRLCGEGHVARDAAERAWRKVRAAAQGAEAEGRAILVQRRAGEVVEYLAIGPSR